MCAVPTVVLSDADVVLCMTQRRPRPEAFEIMRLVDGGEWPIESRGSHGEKRFGNVWRL